MRSGNENIHMLTMDGRQRLRIDMTDWRNNKYYVEYDHFPSQEITHLSASDLPLQTQVSTN